MSDDTELRQALAGITHVCEQNGLEVPTTVEELEAAVVVIRAKADYDQIIATRKNKASQRIIEMLESSGASNVGEFVDQANGEECREFRQELLNAGHPTSDVDDVFGGGDAA